MSWCQTQNSYRKCRYPHGVLLKEHFWLMVFLLTPQTLWWFWQCLGHMFPNESIMNHHICWTNLLPTSWFDYLVLFVQILYLSFERKKTFLKVFIYLRVFHMHCYQLKNMHSSQPAFTCSKLTIETLEQDVKYVQS